MYLKEIAQRIISDFDSKYSKERPFLVAIDGLSGAGKTILTEELAKELIKFGYKPLIIHIDDYIETREKRYNTGRKEWEEYYYLQWNTEKLEKELFKKLFEGEQIVELNFYDSQADAHKRQELSVSSDQIILVEGVFLQRREWKSYYDLTVFIDCPRQLRYQRVLKRDSYIGNLDDRMVKYEKRYWPGEDYYLERVKPMENADLVHRIELKSWTSNNNRKV